MRKLQGGSKAPDNSAESAKNTSRRQMIRMMGGVAASAMVMSSASAKSLMKQVGEMDGKRPNIVLLMMDDTGFSDIGAFGSEIQTPNIDALATNGLRYNRFDTCAICAPTRAALLTGRNPQTVHMEDLPPTRKKGPAPGTPYGQGLKAKGAPLATSGEMPLNTEMLPQAMVKAGYHTYALGKWHICPIYKDQPERNKIWEPKQRGFEYYYGFLSGHTDQYHPDLVENNTRLPDPYRPGYHLTVDLIDHAITLMDPKREDDKPKFLYLALGAAHTPYQCPKAYVDAYRGRYDEGWDKIRTERFARQKKMGILPKDTVLPPRGKGDPAWGSLSATERKVFARFMETYAGFITHTDAEIGRFVSYLKETGQFDNTLFIFITDNGAASEGGAHGGWKKAYADKTPISYMAEHLDEAGSPSTYMLYPRPWAWACDTPFRRYKLWPFLGGVRTPMIVSWPKQIHAHGTIRHQMVNMIDLAPTILDVAGGHFSSSVDGVKQIPVAGKSVKKTFLSATAATRRVQFFELRGNRAITDGDWRAISMHNIDGKWSDDGWRLFNVAVDYSESTDLAEKYPRRLAAMKKLWLSEAHKYTDQPYVKPVRFLYENNGFGNAIKLPADQVGD